jgi:caffeoyl-CoA O-methyltransferase
VDAEKQGYLDYLRAILDGDLIADNGFVVVDNTLMQGQPYLGMPTPNGEAIRAFNDYVCSEERVQQVMVPLRDGLTLIRRVDSHQTADSNGANDE